MLSEAGKYLLLNGLNCNILSKKIDHADNLVSFELLYRYSYF